jgi:hypothetical protein
VSEIRVAYQDEGDQILDAIDAARKTLDGDELRVAEQIVWHALEQRGVTRVGDLLEELETASPAVRRQIVDRARQSLGMKTLGAEEADREFERANANLPPGRDAEGKVFQGCHAPELPHLSAI